MREYREKTVQEVAACTCDRCGRCMTPEDDEWCERLSLDWHGGFDSVFGDGTHVSLDLCQHCVRDTLGAWLRVDHPAAPADNVRLKRLMARTPAWEQPVAQGGSVRALKGSVPRPVAPASVDAMNPGTWRMPDADAAPGQPDVPGCPDGPDARVIHACAEAMDVFEHPRLALAWLLTPNPALGMARPVDLLSTADGTDQVHTILGRIRYGVWS
jgi:hypothetical protein